jgi:four helix bundle protein
MIKEQSAQHYDLEERTFKFAKDVIKFCKSLPKSVIDTEIIKQLVRAATSVGANYIEANGALSKKDFVMRIKICRKEAKESGFWLKLLDVENPDKRNKREILLKESKELNKIFGSIVTKSL